MAARLHRNTFLLCIMICVVTTRPIGAALFDWLYNKDEFATHESTKSPQVYVPFESKTEDEKFLEEALKFTDIMKSSALDICQHNVVLKIKTSCASMTEEELAKMSVNLLNCQSQVDDRTNFPCTETMTLKECTKPMDPNMWNAYHMMNNRARAVCLAARRAQFQALSEMTVNKLLFTAQQQISRMADIQKGQEELEALTVDTMSVVREGNIDIRLEQDKIKTAQQSIQSSVMLNLKELSREKSLIAAGNKELNIIKQKIDDTNKEIMLQSLERSGHHQQLISDLTKIQKQAEEIFRRIDESTLKMMKNHHLASKQYEETLMNLKKINETVGYLSDLFVTTHKELTERIEWVKSFLGKSGEEINKVSAVVLHLAYLLMGMLLASFLQMPLITRTALVIILPLNLMLVYENKSDAGLDFIHITAALLCISLVNTIVNFILCYVVPRRPKYFLMEGNGQGINGKPNGAAKEPLKVSWIRRQISIVFARVKGAVSTRLMSNSVQENSNDSKVTPRPGRDEQVNESLNASFVSSTGRDPYDNNDTVTPHQQAYLRNNRNCETLVSRWLDTADFPARPATPLSTASIRRYAPTEIVFYSVICVILLPNQWQQIAQKPVWGAVSEWSTVSQSQHSRTRVLSHS